MLACWEKWKILLDINQALELARGLHIIFSGRQSTVVNRIKNYTNIFIFGYKELTESEKKKLRSRQEHFTVKPLYSGHHRDFKIVSVIERCPLHRVSS